MPIMIGAEELSAVYVGANDLDSIYAGNELVFSAYNTVQGYLPLPFIGKSLGYLTDYSIFGTNSGAGIPTESGEPGGYKIPITNTSGQNIDNYNLYIGGTKLGAEEYLNYAEQKIYKRTNNIITFGDKEFALTSGHVSWKTHENTVYITSDGANSAVSATLSYYKTNLNFTLEAGTYSFRFTRDETLVGKVTPRIRRVSDNELIKDAGSGTFTLAEDTELYFTMYINANTLCNYAACTITIVPGSTVPSEFIPYYTNTTPPVDLPQVRVFQGDNTMNSAQVIGNVILKGKIKEFEGNLWKGSFNLSSLWPTDNLFTGATAASNYFMSSEYYFPVKSGEVYNFNWTNNTAQDIRVIIREYEESGAYYDTVGNQPDLGLNLTDINWTIPSTVKYWSVTFRQYNMSYSIDDTMVTVNRLQRVIT